MEASEDRQLERGVRQLLRDPITLKEIERMRDRGRSEEYIQNWLRQIAKLNGYAGEKK